MLGTLFPCLLKATEAEAGVCTPYLGEQPDAKIVE
jgi:hypothetical protein